MKNLLWRFVVSKRWLLLVLPFLAGDVLSEIIPSDRRVAWDRSSVGFPGGIPLKTNIYTTLTSPTVSSINSAIKAAPANSVVQLGSGTFSLSGMIDWTGVKPGVVLRGNGPQTTRLVFSSGYIYMRSGFSEGAMSVDADLSASVTPGSSTLTFASVPTWVKVGHFYIVDQLDDPSFVAANTGREGSDCYRMRTGNGPRGLGQLIKVASKTATTVTAEYPLFYPFSTTFQAQIAEAAYDPTFTTPLYQCGIEDLGLEQTFSGSTHMIIMENCDSCYVKNVDSYNVGGNDHVITYFSYRCEVRDSTFRYSHLYNGGQGYGVGLYDVSTKCLVENNIFQHLHVSMQVNYGSSGNVIAYNYAYDGVSDVGEEPSINTHGHHSHHNLFEGNYCVQKAMFDCIHGSASHNTLFRNRILGYQAGKTLNQCAIDIDRYNRLCNAVGNVLGVSGQHNMYERKAPNDKCLDVDKVIWKFGYVNAWDCDIGTGYDDFTTVNVLRHGNYDVVTSGIVWDPNIPDHTLPTSYYLASKPAWFGDRPWPPFDPLAPSGSVLTNLPAGYRAVFGTPPPGAGSGNRSPIVAAVGSPLVGLPPLAVNFSSAGSSDPEGTPLTYSWTFGDGGVSTAANPSHTYQNAGTFVAKLTVSDGTNSSASSDITVAVGNQPPIAVATATPNSGAPPLAVNFSSASSSDPEHAAMSYSWTFGDGSAGTTTANPSHTYQTPGAYVAKLIVSDGQLSGTNTVTVTVVNPSTGLVAAYGFDEGSGSTVGDLSGNGNSGTVTGGIWTTGRLGGALAFDGTSTFVTVNDSASLDLTSAMTLEAWVYPNALGGWRDIIYKGSRDIYLLMGSTPQAAAPAVGGSFATSSLFGSSALPLNVWSHLAGTYDGTTLRLFINGVQVASQPQTGPITTATGPLAIGGDPDYGQYWSGLIDEVRIYNRALGAAEIQTDMTTPVAGNSPAPTPPRNLRVVSQ